MNNKQKAWDLETAISDIAHTQVILDEPYRWYFTTVDISLDQLVKIKEIPGVVRVHCDAVAENEMQVNVFHNLPIGETPTGLKMACQYLPYQEMESYINKEQEDWNDRR